MLQFRQIGDICYAGRRKTNTKHIYTMYICIGSQLYEKQGPYPTVILWVWYGYPMVSPQVWPDYGRITVH